jgi:hypothetical protein
MFVDTFTNTFTLTNTFTNIRNRKNYKYQKLNSEKWCENNFELKSTNCSKSSANCSISSAKSQIYAIVPSFNYPCDRILDVIVFASKSESLATNMMNYLNYLLDDNEMLNHMQSMAHDVAQDVIQLFAYSQRFRLILCDKMTLEGHYECLDVYLPKVQLIYDFLAIEGMINISGDKILSSQYNDKYYATATLIKIRTLFGNEHIV